MQEVSFINDKDQKTKRIVTVTKGTRDDDGHKFRRQYVSQERGSRLSSFVIKRMFTKGDSSLSHIMTSVPGSSVLFHFDKEQRTYEKQHVGILLLNTP